jgi:hypothetical protein
MLRDLLAGRLGVDATAQVSMSATSALRQALSGAVVALMYLGDNVFEDIAVARAEHDCVRWRTVRRGRRIEGPPTISRTCRSPPSPLAMSSCRRARSLPSMASSHRVPKQEAGPKRPARGSQRQAAIMASE